MASTSIIDYLSHGNIAARPVSLTLSTGAIGIFYAGDTGDTWIWDGSTWKKSNTGGGGGGGGASPFDRATAIPTNPGFDPEFSGILASTILSNNNKTATPVSGGPYNVLHGTPARFKGKYYFEIKFATSVLYASAGVSGSAGHNVTRGEGQLGIGNTIGQLGWEPSVGYVRTHTSNGNETITTIATWTATNDLCFALNLDTGLIWMRVNAGNWNNNASADPATGTLGITLAAAYSGGAGSIIWPSCCGTTAAINMYLLSADFSRTPPTGFLPWGGS